MNKTLVAAALAALAPVGWAPAQDKPRPTTEVKKRLADFKKLANEKEGAADHVAIQIIDELVERYPKMVPKDQGRFVAGIAECLTRRRVKREPGKGKDELFRRAVRALGITGKKGSRALRIAFESDKFERKEWDSLRGDMLEQLGVGKDPKSVDLLIETCRRSESDSLRRRAGAALRHFEHAPLKIRKEIGKQMIREWINIHGNAYGTTDPDNAAQRQRSTRRLNAVSGAWNATLRKLTRQNKISGPQKWQDFYNSADWKKNWDKMAATSAGKKNSRRKKRRG